MLSADFFFKFSPKNHFFLDRGKLFVLCFGGKQTIMLFPFFSYFFLSPPPHTHTQEKGYIASVYYISPCSCNYWKLLNQLLILLNSYSAPVKW